jgi:hypothetical protein
MHIKPTEADEEQLPAYANKVANEMVSNNSS